MSPPDPLAAGLPLANTVASLPTIAFCARRDGVIEQVSRGWMKAFGSQPVNLGPFTRSQDPLAAGRATASPLPTAALTLGEIRSESLVEFRDGTNHWVVCDARAIADGTGGVGGWFATVTTIDDQKVRLLESSADCINILDLEARLLSMSPNGQQLLAVGNVESLLGTSWIDFWTGDDRVAARAAIGDARTGRTGRFTGRFFVGGEPGWFDVTVTAINDAAGSPKQLLVVSRDVTVQRKAADALRESEERYRVFTEAMPGVTWSARPNGDLDFVSEQWSRSRGRDSHLALGEAWLEALHPEDRAAVRARWRRSIQTGEPYEASFRVVMADGNYRWQLVRARPIRNAAGAIVRWIGVNADIDEQRRSDEARDRFVALAENSSDVIAIADVAGSVVYINAAARRLLEIQSLDEAKATPLIDYFQPADRAYARDHILAAVEREGRHSGTFAFRNFRTGAPVPVAYNFFHLIDANGAVNGIATVSRDRSRSARIEAGFQLLSRVGAATLNSLDYLAILQNIGRAFVPEYAAYCVMDVFSPEKHWQRIVIHPDPQACQILHDLPEPEGDLPSARALHHGESARVVLDADVLGALGGQPERVAAARALNVRSFIAVPVVTPSADVVGALTCVRLTGDGRADFHTEDVTFVQEVGRRAGAAIANARLYERERRIAVELQAASLPASLPQLETLKLFAAYRPGSDEATIGGDWYDAFVLADGRVAITLGDVLGHGLHAAVTMTKLRQAMQSAAMVDPDPHVMLSVADKTLQLLDSEGYATAIAAIYDPSGATLTYASAGHPPPILRTPDGSVSSCSGTGLMLGLRGGAERDVMERAVAAGSSIVFFTDGLIEATRDIATGMASLLAAVARFDVSDAPDPAHAIVAAVLGQTKASDDIAVIVAQTSARTAR